jgi:hypothetical protein
MTLEWHFLKPTLAILVGVLPFGLATINTSGKVAAAVWAVFYIFAVGATSRVYAGLIWDALRVASGREPRFLPLFERAFEENKGRIEQARAVLPTPILWLTAFIQVMNPLSVTGIVAGLYVRLRPRVLAHPPGEAHLGRSDVMAYYEARKLAQSFEPQERELVSIG